MLASILLNKTLDRLQDHGWTKGALLRDDNSTCLLGALNHVSIKYKTYNIERVRVYVQETISVRAPENSLKYCTSASIIADFNDLQSTTYEDIKLILKDAIARAETDGN